ncbi:RDD family protein [Aneurinibacillus sp. REN35]|uniref:RDD family protein n=1 Tax=Aneurinibacillus sp. REN35 TaxID=3237286 RepID=UPI003526FD29
MEANATRYAGFWIRFLAALIDGIVLGAVSYILGLASTEVFSFQWTMQNLLGLLYYIVLTGLWGQTLGKMVVGVRVVRTSGSIAGWGAIVLRETIGKIVSAIVLLLGYIWAGFDKRKQGWHDKMADTVVIKTK